MKLLNYHQEKKKFNERLTQHKYNLKLSQLSQTKKYKNFAW
jgi:hypothetical protein